MLFRIWHMLLDAAGCEDPPSGDAGAAAASDSGSTRGLPRCGADGISVLNVIACLDETFKLNKLLIRRELPSL